MLSATFLAIFFVPAFFVIMLKVFKVKRAHESYDKHDTSRQNEGEDAREEAPAK